MQQQSGGVPPVSSYKKTGKKTSGLPRSAMKTSPSKSQIGGATNRTMQQPSADFNYEGVPADETGV